MAEIVNVYDAKTRLSQLIARVEDGEEITIARHGRPVARLVPFTEHQQVRTPGIWRGQVKISDDFDNFSDDEDREWYGR
jgi:prevent-host-death family protein